ncbi:MAG: SH3 domain-containing protein [Anaerolineae bacterium]|nr:SH3 domain-containing protein [Anaerolineae bacterium]
MPNRVRALALAALTVVLIAGVLPLPVALAAEADPPPAVSAGQQLAQPIVIVNTSFLNVRSGPGPQYTVLGIVPGATTLPVVGRNRDASWWQVESDFGIGWVYAEYVIPRGDFRAVPYVRVTAATVAQPTAVVVGTPVNVYVLPDVNGDMLGVALAGAELVITGRTADNVWWQVETNVGYGWLLQAAVTLRGSGSVVPVIDPYAGTGVTPSGDLFVPAGQMTGTASSSGRPVIFVYSERVQVLDAPRSDGSHLAFLEFGTRAEVFDRAGGYVLIMFNSNSMGWVREADVAISDPSEWRTQVFFAGPGLLTLRSSPDDNASTSATIAAGERLVVVDASEDSSWLLLNHANGMGWARWQSIFIIYAGPPTAPAGATNGAPASSTTGGTVAQPVTPQLNTPYIIINTSYLNVRSGPGAQYTVVATVSGGTRLDIIGSTPDTLWFQVVGDFGTGWVDSEFVIFRGEFGLVRIIRYQDVAGTVQTAEAIVSAPINVYRGAGVATGLLGTASAGLILPITGRTADGAWLRVQTDIGPGWVLYSTVTVRGNLALVPVVG